MSRRLAPVLVTGATGYVGGRLVPELLRAGFRVRAAARTLERLRGRPWATDQSVELVEADVLDPESLRAACQGAWAAYYLVHSMAPGVAGFSDADRRGARYMADAAASAGLRRIIYLSGLGEDSDDLSEHLRSRAEVAEILQSGSVPVTVLRAAMLMGSGSASFEIVRYLVDRLPVMVTPRWLATISQPIAISNALAYLLGCLEHEETVGETYDIGGPDLVTYRTLLEIYAEEAGMRKPFIIPVPVLTPRLSSYWINFVTPISAAVAQPLAEGLRNPTVCKDDRIRRIIPQRLLTPREVIRRVLEEWRGPALAVHPTETAGAALVERPAEWTMVGDPPWAGGRIYVDARRLEVAAPIDAVWDVVRRIGGETGWYAVDWLWSLRGFFDRLVGGVGLRRTKGRRESLAAGDEVDFWRVAAVTARERLVLTAEMKLPGRAWLEFTLRPLGDDRTEIAQTARFIPRGLIGIAYWYTIAPFHALVFGGMLRGIARAATRPVPSG